MKKFLLTVAAVLAAAGAFAQEVRQEVIAESASESVTALKLDSRSNWFISLGAGPQVFFGDHDRQAKFGDRIAPALDLSFGKWFSPSIGVRLMWSGLQGRGATQTWGDRNGGVYSTGKEVPGKWTHEYGFLAKSKFNFFTLHADVMFDLCNIIGGYKADRKFGFAPYIGVGWGHVTSAPHQDAIVGNLGLYGMWHVSKAFDINLDLRGTLMPDGFDGQEGRRSMDGNLGLTVGVAYRFAPRGWSTVSTRVVEKVVYDNDAVNELRQQVAQLIAANEKLEKEKAGHVVTHKTVSEVNGNYLIYFPINVSALSNADRAQMEMVAKMIKESDPQTGFSIVGYADKSTGNPEINMTLSRERAQSVREYLVKEYGIPADRLEVSWKGGVGNMFLDDPALSRVVIISPKK